MLIPGKKFSEEAISAEEPFDQIVALGGNPGEAAGILLWAPDVVVKTIVVDDDE